MALLTVHESVDVFSESTERGLAEKVNEGTVGVTNANVNVCVPPAIRVWVGGLVTVVPEGPPEQYA